MSLVEQPLEYEDAVLALMHLNGELVHLSILMPSPADAPPIYATRAVLERAETRSHPESPSEELVVLHFSAGGTLVIGPASFARGKLTEHRQGPLVERELLLELDGAIVQMRASGTAAP